MLRWFPTFQVATICFHVLFAYKITTVTGWQSNCSKQILFYRDTKGSVVSHNVRIRGAQWKEMCLWSLRTKEQTSQHLAQSFVMYSTSFRVETGSVLLRVTSYVFLCLLRRNWSRRSLREFAMKLCPWPSTVTCTSLTSASSTDSLPPTSTSSETQSTKQHQGQAILPVHGTLHSFQFTGVLISP